MEQPLLRRHILRHSEWLLSQPPPTPPPPHTRTHTTERACTHTTHTVTHTRTHTHTQRTHTQQDCKAQHDDLRSLIYMHTPTPLLRHLLRIGSAHGVAAVAGGSGSVDPNVSTGATIGIVLGSVGGVLLLILIIVLIMKWWRAREGAATVAPSPLLPVTGTEKPHSAVVGLAQPAPGPAVGTPNLDAQQLQQSHQQVLVHVQMQGPPEQFTQEQLAQQAQSPQQLVQHAEQYPVIPPAGPGGLGEEGLHKV